MNDILDIPQLIAEVITEVQTTAEGRGVHVTATNVAGMPRWVEADEAELRRLLLNLLDIVLGTAMDGTVTVRLELIDAGRDLWTFVVEWRSGEDAAIEEMRCTFATALPPSQAGAAERPLKVLVADDSPQQRSIVAAYLAGTPHQVTEATGGGHAIACVQAEAFDVVLMDLQMPEIDGLAATRAIREFEKAARRPRAHIVALSAGGAEDASAALAAGGDDTMAKPISRSALFRALAALPVPPPPGPPPAPGPPPIRTLGEAREELAAALSAGPDVQMDRLRLLGRTLRAMAAETGLGDIAHLAAALERAADAGSPREAVTAARTLQAWLARDF